MAPLSSEPRVPAGGRQRTLIDFEDTLAEALRERYQLPPGDLVTAGVWARASIGALRTALVATTRMPPGEETTGTPVIETVRACFAALSSGL